MMMPRTIRQYRNKSVSAILPLFYKLSSLIWYRFTCPTSKRNYWARPIKVWRVKGRTFVQVRCRECDASNRAKADRLFDRTNPQIHVYEV
jgi:hypothetical protein